MYKEGRTPALENTTENAPDRAEKPRRAENREAPAAPESAKEEVIDVESPALAPEIKAEVTDTALDLMRDVFSGIDDYVIFASTAMYLQGRERGIDTLDVPPGDLDVAVSSEETLKRVRERLGNVPGVRFDNSGRFKQFKGEDAKVLSGTITMKVNTSEGRKTFSYPFEVFYQSRMVKNETASKGEKLRGLNVLNLEGLQKQYGENLKFESRVQQSADEVAKFLANPEIAQRLQAELAKAEPDPWVGELKKSLQLSDQDLQNFYKIKAEMDAAKADGTFDKKAFDSKLATTLAGLKTKIPKRLKNVMEVHDALRVNVGEEPETKRNAA